MVIESVAVLEMDDTYTPTGLHVGWAPTRFIEPPTEPFGPQQVDPGAVLYLRDGTTTLATAQVTGSRRTLVDAAEDAADTAGPWLPVLRALVEARDAEHTVQVLETNLALMLDNWQAATDPAADPIVTRSQADAHHEQLEAAYACEALIRGLVPHEDQVETRLPEAVGTHTERLRTQGRMVRAQALRDMPAPDQPRPVWHQVGPYRPTKMAEYDLRSGVDYYGDLPVQLLRGWGAVDLSPLSPQEITARRNYLVQWAIKRGAKKTQVADASGIARSTIDRLLAEAR